MGTLSLLACDQAAAEWHGVQQDSKQMLSKLDTTSVQSRHSYSHAQVPHIWSATLAQEHHEAMLPSAWAHELQHAALATHAR